MEYSIGEFSRICRLPVRTIRYYQEEGILMPQRVDPDSGYRYYGPEAAEKARIVRALRELGFSIAEIRELTAAEEGGTAAILGRKARELGAAAARYARARRRLEELARPRPP